MAALWHADDLSRGIHGTISSLMHSALCKHTGSFTSHRGLTMVLLGINRVHYAITGVYSISPQYLCLQVSCFFFLSYLSLDYPQSSYRSTSKSGLATHAFRCLYIHLAFLTQRVLAYCSNAVVRFVILLSSS